MNYLAINTAGVKTQAVLHFNNVKIEREIEFSHHSENLFPLLEQMFEEANCSVKDMQYLGCVIGPGSFTGVRIGVATIKGFSFPYNIPCIAINSLNVLAYNILQDDKNSLPICAIINAGAGLVYHQMFEVENGDLVAKYSARLDKFKHFTGYIHSNYEDKVQFCFNNNNEKNTIAELISTSQDFTLSGLDRAMRKCILDNNFIDNIVLAPLYLRVSQAEQLIANVEFREATLHDISNLTVLESQGDEWDLQWNKTAIEQSFANPNYKCFLVISQNKAIGFISFMQLVDELEVLRVVVSKEARLQGIAQKLFIHLIEKYKNTKYTGILLEVNEQNYPALSLYQKLNFQEIGRRKDYYEDGQDAILMKLTI